MQDSKGSYQCKPLFRTRASLPPASRPIAPTHSTPPARAPNPASSVPRSTPCATASPAAPPSCLTEDAQAYQLHCRQFRDEYQPTTPTEIQLVQELADTAWRLNRIPLLEANLLTRATDTRATREPIACDIAEATRALATLGLHGQRLSRQFQKTLDQLRALQTERREREQHDLKRAASLLELHKHKGIPYDPAQDGFVFSSSEIEAHSQRLMRQNEARRVAYFRFEADPQLVRAAGL